MFNFQNLLIAHLNGTYHSVGPMQRLEGAHPLCKYPLPMLEKMNESFSALVLSSGVFVLLVGGSLLPFQGLHILPQSQAHLIKEEADRASLPKPELPFTNPDFSLTL